jgi:hypothetical protein
MKTFSKVAAQGELRFLRLPDNFKIPANATKVAAEHGHVIVGHSETGHHHVMNPACTTLLRLPDDILDCLLVVDKPDQLKHLRDFDTHESVAFEPGIYKVTTAREHTPEGWRRTAD